MKPGPELRWRSWWLAARMAGWVALLRLGVRRVSVTRLVRFVEPEKTTTVAHERDISRIVALSQRVTAALAERPETQCLVRSLVAYRYLIRAGVRPELRVGFERPGAALRGHAWVELDGMPVTDDHAAVAHLTTTLAFRPGGSGPTDGLH